MSLSGTDTCNLSTVFFSPTCPTTEKTAPYPSPEDDAGVTPFSTNVEGLETINTGGVLSIL